MVAEGSAVPQGPGRTAGAESAGGGRVRKVVAEGGMAGSEGHARTEAGAGAAGSGDHEGHARTEEEEGSEDRGDQEDQIGRAHV